MFQNVEYVVSAYESIILLHDGTWCIWMMKMFSRNDVTSMILMSTIKIYISKKDLLQWRNILFFL